MAVGHVLTLNASLDSDGWNTDGKIRSSTLIRTRTLVAFIREEVLQLSLGTVILDLEKRAL
jgi:hypothetical protein